MTAPPEPGGSFWSKHALPTFSQERYAEDDRDEFDPFEAQEATRTTSIAADGIEGRCLRSGLAELENVAQEARLAQPRRHGAADRGLDLARGYPPAAGAGGDAANDEIGAEVVAIAPALPAGMARPHLPAVRIEEPTSQRAWPLRRAPPAAGLPVGGEAILHRLPERLVHDRRVLAGMDLLVMPDAADEERVGEQGIELAAGEGGAAAAASVAMPALRRAEAGSIELGLQPVHRAEREHAVRSGAPWRCASQGRIVLTAATPAPPPPRRRSRVTRLQYRAAGARLSAPSTPRAYLDARVQPPQRRRARRLPRS